MDQGDPLAPLLFSCCLGPRLAKLEEALVDLAREHGLDPHRVRVLAYLDDVSVLTPPELAAHVLPAAQRILGEVNLELEPRKTQMWSAASPFPEGLEERWCENGLTLMGVTLGSDLPPNGLPAHNDAWRVDLGDATFSAQRCSEVAARAALLLERLSELPTLASPHLPAVHTSALLLRLCGAGKVTHLLRSTPPAQTLAAAKAFDTALLHAYEALAALDPLTTNQALQCQLGQW